MKDSQSSLVGFTPIISLRPEFDMNEKEGRPGARDIGDFAERLSESVKLAHPVVDRYIGAVIAIFEKDECALVPTRLTTAFGRYRTLEGKMSVQDNKWVV